MPDELAVVWPGCGTDADFGGQASIKLQFRLELLSGGIEHLSLTDGKTHDCKAQKGFNPLAAGSLRLADLGYFSLTALKEMNQEKVLWLTRFKVNCQLFDTTEDVDGEIQLGKREKLPARLLAKRVCSQVANKRRRQIRKHAKNKGKTIGAG